MTPEIEFYLKILGTLCVSGVIWMVMQKIQKRREDEADAKFNFEMELIEMRNKKVEKDDSL